MCEYFRHLLFLVKLFLVDFLSNKCYHIGPKYVTQRKVTVYVKVLRLSS